MKNKILSVSLAGIILFSTGCASILSKSSYPITINSTPSQAKITITDKKGIETYKGNTPATLKLKASNAFFSRARYQVKFELDGYDERIIPVEFKIDGWYWGNILIGGFLGFLIIDPATGAMYKLETEYINETLSKSTALNENEKDFRVYTIDQIPNQWNDYLVEIVE